MRCLVSTFDAVLRSSVTAAFGVDVGVACLVIVTVAAAGAAAVTVANRKRCLKAARSTFRCCCRCSCCSTAVFFTGRERDAASACGSVASGWCGLCGTMLLLPLTVAEHKTQQHDNCQPIVLATG